MGVMKAISVDDLKSAGAIREADVVKLRRMFHADARIDRAEADQLIELNRACPQQDPAWVDCFVEMLTDHLVNQVAPEGYLTTENADWLISSIAPSGRVETRPEMELLINVLDKSRWSPQGLARFALHEVMQSIVHGDGPHRAHLADNAPGVVMDGDVEVIRRIIYAFGGDGNVAITRLEAEILFAINDATVGAPNAESWQDLFVKAIANCVLTASGYMAPSREEALAREAWLDRRGELSPGNVLGGMLSAYRGLSKEEQAINRLERHKIEIITGEEVSAVEAAWLVELLNRDGELTENELALLSFLKDQDAEIHADLMPLIDRATAEAA